MYEKYLGSILRNVLFSNIDTDGILSMLNCLRPDILHCQKNSYIAVAGDDFKGLGIVLSGEGVISRENAAGEPCSYILFVFRGYVRRNDCFFQQNQVACKCEGFDRLRHYGAVK